MKPFQGQSAFGFCISFHFFVGHANEPGTFTLRGDPLRIMPIFGKVTATTTPGVVICVSIKDTRLSAMRRGVNNEIVIRQIIHAGRAGFIRDPIISDRIIFTYVRLNWSTLVTTCLGHDLLMG